MTLKAGIIGCGRPKTPQRPWGGQAQRHVEAMKGPAAQLAAMSDVALENAQAFQAEHGGERIYTDYREMLQKESLDFVSICTWPGLHAEMVIACAQAGVRAIHCEKPMALTFGDARRMVEECESHGAQLTFNHQRRFGEPFQRAREMLRAGEIGELQRVEGMCDNLFDWGTHWFDMFFFYNGEAPAQWVLGQIEWRGAGTVFGAPIEKQGLSHIRFENGVHGLLVTGHQSGNEWGARNRLVGTRGIIEVGVREPNSKGDSVPLRILGRGDGWQNVPTSEGLDAGEAVTRGILDAIDALQNNREPELSGRRALRATEVIFATYESSRRRGRVEMPLQAEDSALADLIAEGAAQV